MDNSSSPSSNAIAPDSENTHQQANTLHASPGYAAMTQTYGAALQQMPFSPQQVGMLPAGYAGMHASAGLQELTAYQSNVNAQMAQYQAAQALANASTFSSETTKLLKNRSVYGLGSVNPGQRHGRWSEDEHQQFLSLMKKYGRSWTKISQVMMTRSEPQVRSHAQKHFLRISRLEKQAAAGDVNKEAKDNQHEDVTARMNCSSERCDDAESGTGPIAETIGGDHIDKQKRIKRRRTMNTASYNASMTNLGILGTMPDAAALVTMAAHAAAAQHVPPKLVDTEPVKQQSSRVTSTCSFTSSVPHALLPTLTLQQSQQQPHQPQVQHQRSHPQTQANHQCQVTNSAYNAAFLQNIQAPYTLQQLQQASIGQHLQQAQVMRTGYYNCMPFMRADGPLNTPSWSNLAVATSLGMVSQSPWVFPLAQLTTSGGMLHANSMSSQTTNPYAQAVSMQHTIGCPNQVLQAPASEHLTVGEHLTVSAASHERQLTHAFTTHVTTTPTLESSVARSPVLSTTYAAQDPTKSQPAQCQPYVQDVTGSIQHPPQVDPMLEHLTCAAVDSPAEYRRTPCVGDGDQFERTDAAQAIMTTNGETQASKRAQQQRATDQLESYPCHHDDPPALGYAGCSAMNQVV